MHDRKDDFLAGREPDKRSARRRHFAVLILGVLAFGLVYNLLKAANILPYLFVQLAPFVLIVGIAVYTLRKRIDHDDRN